jgi:hypothetical protein
MKIALVILLHLLLLLCPGGKGFTQSGTAGQLDFYGDTLQLATPGQLPLFKGPLTEEAIRSFTSALAAEDLALTIRSLVQYRESQKPDDWLFYQLIRKAAQRYSPKADDYIRYTLFKWYFLSRTGYETTLSLSSNKLLFYVRSDENIYNIPFRMRDGRQFVCLNYHDYGAIDFEKERFVEVVIPVEGALHPFSYKVTRLPHFKKDDYLEKEVAFSYYENHYQFRIQLSREVKKIFQNYPVVDYTYQFNIPLSTGTYNTLIPSLKEKVRDKSTKDGVDFLMHFTRYAFLFKPDREAFGSEKRLSAEQTLLSEYSDCEDRAALFFYLVREIYNLPMIVLTYPDHVTVGVQFDKAYGTTVEYGGKQFSICEPTPQRRNLRIGQTLPGLEKQPFSIAYAYLPR